jgi:hypothetical protein
MKIFQIGFNKTGTYSLFQLLHKYTQPHIKAIHWDKGLLAYSMYMNKQMNKPLLSEKYQQYDFFSDMECCYIDNEKSMWVFIFMTDFKLLDQQNPNSKFILNIRDKTKWLHSRANHVLKYGCVKNGEIAELIDTSLYIDSHKIFYQQDIKEQIIDLWSKQYDQHILNVMEYFKDRPNDLLVFDIEKDPFSKIADFFQPCGLSFQTDRLPHANKTKDCP